MFHVTSTIEKKCEASLVHHGVFPLHTPHATHTPRRPQRTRSVSLPSRTTTRTPALISASRRSKHSSPCSPCGLPRPCPPPACLSLTKTTSGSSTRLAELIGAEGTPSSHRSALTPSSL